MQYELYIDVFFLVNFLLDYLVLMVVKKILKCSATHGKIVKGAVVGAGTASILIALPIAGAVKLLLLHTGVSLLMLQVTFGIRRQDVLKKWIVLYLTGILMGGLLTSLSQYLGSAFRMINLFLVVVLCSSTLLLWIVEFVERYFQVNGGKCRVRLYLNGNVCVVSAIKDTGNMLYDQITGKPVHIISNNAIKKLTKEETFAMRYIPYHTVQGDRNVMPLIKIDKMSICGREKREIKAPLLGISECSYFGDGEYELILHPKDLRESEEYD